MAPPRRSKRPADELSVAVSTPGGASVGTFRARPSSTVAELKMSIAATDEAARAHGEHAPLFLSLLLPTVDPLKPTLLEDGLTLREAGVAGDTKLTLVRLTSCGGGVVGGGAALPSSHRRSRCVPLLSRPRTCSSLSTARDLPDLTQGLIDHGVYDKYAKWRAEYLSWRQGNSRGASKELADLLVRRGAPDPDAEHTAWRDGYHRWRQGFAGGARGEAIYATARPLQALQLQGGLRSRFGSSASMLSEEDDSVSPLGHGASGFADCSTAAEMAQLPAVVYDVVATDEGVPALVPTDGPLVPPILADELPAEALVTIRSFRFFEDRADQSQIWEQELMNVNSGSLLWLPVHLEPSMHSKNGAKYGRWFTIHYIQTYAKHLSSSYHMANEGSCYPAKTFGSTTANTSTITGEALRRGYFWHVSPHSGGEGSLSKDGWCHLCRAGPFDGSSFLEHWHQAGRPMDPRALQAALQAATEQ